MPVDGIGAIDADLDGVPELVVTSPGQSLIIKPSEGAGIGTWDIRASRHALLSILRRRPEAYHAKLVAFEAAGGQAPAADGDGTTSIHDLVKVREPGLAGRLQYDHHERRSGLVHILDVAATAASFNDTSAPELGDFVEGAFEVGDATADGVRLVRAGSVTTDAGSVPLTIDKTLRFDGDRRTPGLVVEVRAHNPGTSAIDARIGIGWALTMLGGGGNPSAWFDLGDARVAFEFDR